ncbi:hypothetical protein [Aquimarina sp. SS2-1]|uniref:hypothetical protein n=1 Tax=Aquimarina besae TaxID=3342247 RepID=UPI00367027C7
MMKTVFNIKLIKFKTIEELPNYWNIKKYGELLEIMEFGEIKDISTEDLKEMCLLSITDYEPEEAAKMVLEYVFKEKLSKGQLDNLSHEMIDEKLWEEYADLSMHEEFFNVTQLLYKAFNGKFPHPEAVQFQVQISSKHVEDLKIFSTKNEAILIRLLCKGMPENTLIKRLFNKQIESREFEEAKDIIWQYREIEREKDSITFEIISSAYWFKDFKHAESFTAEINVDTVLI